MRPSLIVALILAILVTVFALQNPDAIDVQFLMFKSRKIPLALLLLLTLLIGALITWLFSISNWFKKKKEISALKKDIAQLTSQLNNAQGELLSYRAKAAHTSKDVDEFTKDVDTEQ